MTEKQYKTITDDLMIVQAQMVAMGVDETDMYLAILKHNPFDEDDEKYFEDVVNDLIKMCEEAEFYELCQSLNDIREKIDDRENNIG